LKGTVVAAAAAAWGRGRLLSPAPFDCFVAVLGFWEAAHAMPKHSGARVDAEVQALSDLIVFVLVLRFFDSNLKP
jgi:hypothetical protein